MAAAELDAVLEGPEILLLPREAGVPVAWLNWAGTALSLLRKQFWSALPAAASR